MRRFGNEFLREQARLFGIEGQVGQIVGDKCSNCLGLGSIAVSLDRLTIGSSGQPELMDCPYPRVRSYNTHRLSLLVDRDRVEGRKVLKPIETFNLHGAQIFRIRADLVWRFFPRRVLHRP